MSDTKTSQTQQQPEAAFPFFGLFDDQLKRFEQFQKELAKLEQKNIEQARLMIDESAKLMKESLDYSAKLSAEFRRLMEQGRISTLCERGVGEDAGLYRASFYYGDRRARLVVDASGTPVTDR